MPKQPEGRTVKACRAYAEGRGAWVFNVHGGDSPFQEEGIPDLLMCFRGRFIGVEVKQEGKKASRLQEVVMRRIRKAGGVTGTVDSVEDLEKIFDRISKR